MSKPIASPEVENFIRLLARIPGLGPRSARRAALHLIHKKQDLMEPLGNALQEVAQKIQICQNCANIDTQNPCSICQDDRRDKKTIIVVEDVAALWALERSAYLQAYYHVLGGKLSPLDGIGPQQLNLSSLITRIQNNPVEEVVLAMNATMEGETTAYYIMDLLAPFSLKVTRLAHGVPIGGELDYLDEGTLSQALRARTKL